MRILVTGGAGFIGSHLCEYLLNQGHKIICLDNFFTSKKENIEHLFKNKNFKLIRHNINKCLPEKKIGKIDRIYNLACPASPMHYQFDPVETIKANTQGVINVLALARETGARVLQASTSEVYGDPEEHPQKETYVGRVNCLSPRACYDEGKRCAETLFMDYHRQYGIEIKIIRIFNTYGPRMALGDGRVVSNFIVQALNGENITIYGDGSQTRSFQYVDDLIRAMVEMMETSRDVIGPINIGNPQEIPIKELAERILVMTKSKSELIYYPLPEHDPIQRKPDITLAKEILKWQPKAPLEEGLKKTIEYFRGQIKFRQRNVLVFSFSYLPFIGGIELTLAETIRGLPTVEFDIITARLDKNLPKFEKIDNANIYRIGGRSKIDKLLFPIRAFIKGSKIYKAKKHNLVWAISATYAGIAAFFFKLRHPKTNYLLTLRESTPESKIRRIAYLAPFYRWVYRKPDFIQAAGSSFEKRAREYGYKGRISIVPGAIDTVRIKKDFSNQEKEKIRQGLNLGPSDKFAVSVSHFASQDGIEHLIKAISFLKSDSIKFVIIGEGNKKEFFKKMAEKMGLQNKILFLGLINNSELIKILKLADLFVRPAISGGSGITVLEAMATRTPVISTPTGGAKDFLIDRKTGRIVEIGNPKDIAEKIEEILRDEELRNYLIRNSEELIIKKYYRDKIMPKMRDLIERLIFY